LSAVCQPSAGHLPVICRSPVTGFLFNETHHNTLVFERQIKMTLLKRQMKKRFHDLSFSESPCTDLRKVTFREGSGMSRQPGSDRGSLNSPAYNRISGLPEPLHGILP
ncbi:MAG: hypothetical protein IKM88_15045, partial [Lachnospiraceae bacterium]|nr:hypothetical protein [Lachnospiraceae bacterium]